MKSAEVFQQMEGLAQKGYHLRWHYSLSGDMTWIKSATSEPMTFEYDLKGGFPVMAETTRNHIFSKEISQVIIAAMVLAPNFY